MIEQSDSYLQELLYGMYDGAITKYAYYGKLIGMFAGTVPSKEQFNNLINTLNVNYLAGFYLLGTSGTSYGSRVFDEIVALGKTPLYNGISSTLTRTNPELTGLGKVTYKNATDAGWAVEASASGTATFLVFCMGLYSGRVAEVMLLTIGETGSGKDIELEESYFQAGDRCVIPPFEVDYNF